MTGIKASSDVNERIGFIPLLLTYGSALLLGWTYVSLYSLNRFLTYSDYLGEYGELLQFGAMAVVVVIHEGIHAISFMVFGNLSWNQVEKQIAVNPSETYDPIQFYVYPGEPVSRRAYALGVAMPGIILGVIPSVVGLVTGHAFVMAVGIFGVVLAPIDVSVLLGRLWHPDVQQGQHTSHKDAP